jgi:hypothetical protein
MEIDESLGDRAGAAISRAQMSLLHEQLGQLDRALALIRQAEAEFARMDAAQLAQARRDRARIEAKLSSHSAGHRAEESLPQGVETLRSAQSDSDAHGDDAGLTLQELVGMVVAGCKGDAQAGQQAYDITQALQKPGAPQEYQVLGQALQRLLEGLRDYDEIMQGLPKEAGEVVREVLALIPGSALRP